MQAKAAEKQAAAASAPPPPSSTNSNEIEKAVALQKAAKEHEMRHAYESHITQATSLHKSNEHEIPASSARDVEKEKTEVNPSTCWAGCDEVVIRAMD